MEVPREAVQFLASSANRVAVLSALRDGEATQQSLQEAAGCARSTVARILTDAEDRGWVRSEGSQYWLTPLGDAMLREYTSYLATVEGLSEVADVIEQFPPPLRSLDFQHFRSAEIVEMTADDPSAPFTRTLELLRNAQQFRGVTHTALPEHSKVIVDRIASGQLDFENVFEGTFVDGLRETPERAAMWRSVATDLWVYEGTVPINVHVIDGTVVVWLGQTRGEVAGVLLSEDPAVVDWAEGLFEEYRSEAERLDPDRISV